MMATARELIDAITELATGLPDGMETAVELGICDGKDVQMVDKMDIDHWAQLKNAKPVRRFILLRGHVHPGEDAGQKMPGVASDLDEELRQLTDDDECE
jgi:hypothetical protein